MTDTATAAPGAGTSGADAGASAAQGQEQQAAKTTTTESAASGGTVLGGSGTADRKGGAGADAGAASGDWTASLPEDMRALVKAKGWKGMDDVLGSYANLERVLGGEKLVVPGKDAKPEDWEPVYDKLGRPKDPKDYKIERPKELPQDFPYNANIVESFRPVAHKLGLTNAQAQGLHDWVVAQNIQQHVEGTQERAKANEQNLAALKKEWGKDFDQKSALAARAVRAFGSDALSAWFDKTGLGDDANFIRLFSNIGSAMGESRIVTGQGGGKLLGGPAQAQAEIDRLTADKAFMADLTGDNGSVAKKMAQEKWDRLNSAAAGDGE
jgi:hypothetical protein